MRITVDCLPVYNYLFDTSLYLLTQANENLERRERTSGVSNLFAKIESAHVIVIYKELMMIDWETARRVASSFQILPFFQLYSPNSN